MTVYFPFITLSQSLTPQILCSDFIMVSTYFIVFTTPSLKVYIINSVLSNRHLKIIRYINIFLKENFNEKIPNL